MVILSPELGEKKTTEQLSEIRDMITSGGGEIHNEDVHGTREFAYRIKKFDEGYYAIFNFSMEGEKVKEFEAEFNINAQILRYLVTKTPKHYQFRTLAEYDADLEKMMAEKEAAKKTRKEKTKPAPRKAAPKPKSEEKVEEEVDKSEPKAEKKEEKPAEKLEKVDEKLKSIIDDPDIKL